MTRVKNALSPVPLMVLPAGPVGHVGRLVSQTAMLPSARHPTPMRATLRFMPVFGSSVIVGVGKVVVGVGAQH